MGVGGDECSQALSAINDPFPFKFLIGAFDRDDTDQEVFGQFSERGQGCAGGEAAFTNLAFEIIDNLLVERAGGGG